MKKFIKKDCNHYFVIGCRVFGEMFFLHQVVFQHKINNHYYKWVLYGDYKSGFRFLTHKDALAEIELLKNDDSTLDVSIPHNPELIVLKVSCNIEIEECNLDKNYK